MDELTCRHYIRTRADGSITYGFSTAFEQPVDGDIVINESGGRQFEMLGEQNPSLFDGIGLRPVPRYKWTGTDVVMRTPEEIEFEQAPTLHEASQSKINQLTDEFTILLTSGIPYTVTVTLYGDGIDEQRELMFALDNQTRADLTTAKSAFDEGRIKVPFYDKSGFCFDLLKEDIGLFDAVNLLYTGITSKRNLLLRLVQKATTVEEVNAVGWKLPMPEEEQTVYEKHLEVYSPNLMAIVEGYIHNNIPI